MSESASGDNPLSRRYALCVGIGTYTHLRNRDLQYSVDDANAIAERLEGPRQSNFAVTRLTEPAQTTKAAIEEALDELLNAPDRQAEDLVVIYFSCHGDVYTPDKTFCLLPSNASYQADGRTFKRTTLIGIYDLAKLLSGARVQNIVMFLDVCHSGGAGVALQHLQLDLSAGPNLFLIGAARQDQVAWQSSQLEHGLFTHCLLRSFEQPPAKDGWLTISQIQSFVSNELPWFAKDHPIQIQAWSVSVNSNLPLLRNPSYPELCPLPPLWNVPLPRNLFFTGQEDILSQLASMLQREQKTALTQPQAISGLGGIGKTQLALEYAYRHRQDYHAILWGRADTREALISTFVNIAYLLDLPQKNEKDQMDIVKAVKRWLMDRSHWLLILDNIDELVLVKEFIPPAFRGHLLLTTRAQAMGGLARKLDVKVMTSEVGALLLLRRAGLLASKASLGEAPDEEVTVAKILVEELGGLPLALDQAGAYIEETQCRLTDYQSLYRTRRAKLLEMRGGLVDDHPESVATTWSLSFQKVEQKNPAAAELLRFCAFLHPDAIPEELISTGAQHLGTSLQSVADDPIALNQAIAALNAYSLIRRDTANKTLALHPLVQAVLVDSMVDPLSRVQWAERSVRALNAAFPADIELTTRPRWERLLPHALVAAQLIEQEQISPSEAVDLLNQTAWYLSGYARYRKAEPLLQRALAIREKQLGPEHPATVSSRNVLARLYREAGSKYGPFQYTEKYAEAEQLYRRNLAIHEDTYGPDDPHLVADLNDLASLYDAWGRYMEEESLLQRALSILDQHAPKAPQHLSILEQHAFGSQYLSRREIIRLNLMQCQFNLSFQQEDDDGE